MAEFPKFPLWTDAYLADTTHLTTIQHGALLLLLITAWRSKTYDLPDDDKQLARFAKMTTQQWVRIKSVIAPFWNVEKGRWSNNRMLDELDAVRRLTQQRSDAGKASALKRQHRGSTAVLRYVDGETPPSPMPIPRWEVSKRTDIVASRVVSCEDKKNGFGKREVTIENPNERVARFQKKLAEELIRQGQAGWTIVFAACNPDQHGHEQALQTCKLTAQQLGKGWPHAWPV